jgi:hypothetical protein
MSTNGAGSERSVLDEAARERIRTSATEWIKSQTERLATAGALPVSGRDSPWIDYRALWWALGRESGKGLADELRAAAPGRWDGPLVSPRAEDYAEALLRAVVAGATVDGYPPAEWPGIPSSIDELLGHVESPAQLVRVLRLLTDTDVSEVHGRTVHDVRLLDVRGLMETISGAVKEAASEVDALHVSRGSREPRAFLVGERAGRDPWMVEMDTVKHMVHVSTAIRLITAGSIAEILEIYGQTTMVHVGGPSAFALDPEGRTHWRRIGVVEPETLQAIEAIATRVCELDAPAGGGKVPPPVVVALNRFNRAHRAGPWSDTLIDLAIGLEAALSTGDRDELTLRIRSRAAHLLATPTDPSTVIFEDVGELLALRGSIAHGEIIKAGKWQAMFSARKLDQVFPEDRMVVIFDRWRDLLRRAILARLFLDEGTGADSWKLDRRTSVDGILVGPAGRRRWRQDIRDRARDLGVLSAINPPSPLIDFLHHPYGDSLDH